LSLGFIPPKIFDSFRKSVWQAPEYSRSPQLSNHSDRVAQRADAADLDFSDVVGAEGERVVGQNFFS
jgi:hypothetical protein